MKIGMNVPVMVPGLDRDALLAWCRGIDSAPYSSLAVGERINFPNPAAMVTLSVAAAVTERVQIMSYVLIMPMHNAVNRAKELATIDVVSNGRLCLGVGAGAREEDYKAVGAVFSPRRLSQLEEQVETMKRVWRGEIVVDGPLRPVEPAPLQPGGPEILVGSISQPAIKHISRWADGLAGFSFGPSIDEISNAFALAQKYWHEAEREKPPRLVTSFWFALGSNARDQLDTYLNRYLNFFGPTVATKLAKSVRCDSAQELADMLKRVEDTGADEVSLVPTTADPAELERVAEALGW
ncbi:MAG: alkanesulfonate monooxygenase SsuD [Myxococcota bacterium]|jgi:alkanesulfonate monooxygenase SsuD/methylene tetrahydromethanopterin reductase-like flavin-dependent oxidoreductase (luciferase family)